MVVPDPKWLALLKATGWQTAGLAAACGVFLWLTNNGTLPKPDTWVIQVVAFAGLICAGLALGSLLSNLFRFFPLQILLQRGFAVWQEIGRASCRERV